MEPRNMPGENSHGRRGQPREGQPRSRRPEESRSPNESVPAELGREAHEAADRMGAEASAVAHRWPALTVATVAGLGLLAAFTIGVGEVAVAGAAGYLAYRWLGRRGSSPGNPPPPSPSSPRRED